MSERAERALSAAGIAFDPDSGDLRGPGGAARLAPQPAALLELLSRQAGEIVTRDELKDHLWPGGRVEFDQGIAFALREVRKTLEEVGVDPAVIETLPRRGLRLKGPVGRNPASAGAAFRSGASGSVASDSLRGPGPSRPTEEGGTSRSTMSAAWLVVALASVVVAIAGGLRWATGAAGPPVLVVFPYEFADTGGNGDEAAALRDADVGALTEAVVAALTSSLGGDAGVVGPAGVAGLRGPDDVEGARSALGACLLLSGSVRFLSRDTLVVFSQIVRASDRVHLWAERDTLLAGTAASVLADRIVEGARGAVSRCRAGARVSR